MFEEIPHKGIFCDLITFNAMIQGFCNAGKIVESRNLLDELLVQGLQPSASIYAPIIKKLCDVGDMQGATMLLSDMKTRGIETKSLHRIVEQNTSKRELHGC